MIPIAPNPYINVTISDNKYAHNQYIKKILMKKEYNPTKATETTDTTICHSPTAK